MVDRGVVLKKIPGKLKKARKKVKKSPIEFFFTTLKAAPYGSKKVLFSLL
jgi:hypothetical protein